MKHHVVARHLFEDALRQLDVRRLVFGDRERPEVAVIDHRVAPFFRIIQAYAHFVGHERLRIPPIGHEVVHEMLPHPFLGGDGHKFLPRGIENIVFPLYFFYPWGKCG